MFDLLKLVNNAIMGFDVILNLQIFANLLLYHEFVEILVCLESFFDIGNHTEEVLDVVVGFVVFVVMHCWKVMIMEYIIREVDYYKNCNIIIL